MNDPEEDILSQLSGGAAPHLPPTPADQGPSSPAPAAAAAPPAQVPVPLSEPGVPPKHLADPLNPPEYKKGKIPYQRSYRSRVPKILKDPVTGEPVVLSNEQRKIVDNIPALPSFRQVGKKLRVDQRTVSATFKLPAVQQYFRDVLAKAGVTDMAIATRIKERLDAVVVKEFVVNGELVEGKARPDHEQRGRAIDQALRLQGLDKPPEAEAHRPPVNINIASLTVDELKGLMTALNSSSSSQRPPGESAIEEAEIIEENGNDTGEAGPPL